MAKLSSKTDAEQSNQSIPTNIDALIAALDDRDGMVRQRARHALVRQGETAVEPLIKAFSHRGGYMHWEAAKALSMIGSPKSTGALLQALEDDEFSIRWLAAEGLIAIAAGAVEPLLQALVNRPDSVWLREGAHHVLHDLIHRELVDASTRARIAPVLTALNDIEPTVTVPVAAHKALQTL